MIDWPSFLLRSSHGPHEDPLGKRHNFFNPRRNVDHDAKFTGWFPSAIELEKDLHVLFLEAANEISRPAHQDADIAGFDGGARCAALHQFEIVGYVEVSFLRSRIVTRTATLPKNRRDVVIVGDLVIAARDARGAQNGECQRQNPGRAMFEFARHR